MKITKNILFISFILILILASTSYFIYREKNKHKLIEKILYQDSIGYWVSGDNLKKNIRNSIVIYGFEKGGYLRLYRINEDKKTYLIDFQKSNSWFVSKDLHFHSISSPYIDEKIVYYSNDSIVFLSKVWGEYSYSKMIRIDRPLNIVEYNRKKLEDELKNDTIKYDTTHVTTF